MTRIFKLIENIDHYFFSAFCNWRVVVIVDTSFRFLKDRKSKHETNISNGWQEVYLLFYPLEELSHHLCHGYDGRLFAPFGDSEKIPGNFIYRHWLGVDIVKYSLSQDIY